MLTIQAIGLGLMGVILMIMTKSLILLTLFLLTIPIAWIFLLFTFELKVRFFGKMKYKYVVEEVNKQRKVLKWVSLICSELLIFFTVIIIEFTLLSLYGILGIIIGLVVIGIIGLSSLVYVFTKMFPKEKEITTYYTGGLLRRNVKAGTIVIMVLFVAFLYASIPIMLILLPIIIHMTLWQYFLIDLIITFSLLTLLLFVITPYGLKLPHGKATFKEYAYSIGFTRSKPVGRNVLLGILSFLLYALSTWGFANLLGTYIFDPNVLFGYPTIYNLGWALFYIMLQPGILEEVAFRGVILNLQLKKYSKLTSVIVNGILFGLFHFVNLLFGVPLDYVIFQVFYASCIGVALAYIYVKTESLLPCIILHYLYNSFGQLFVNSLFSNAVNSYLFIIYGVGLVPMILILLFTKLIVRKP